MNYQRIEDATRNKIRSRIGRKQRVIPKKIQRYPESEERELVRVVNFYLKSMHKEIRESIPELLNIYEKATDKSSRLDSLTDLQKNLRSALRKIEEVVINIFERYGIRKRVNRIATATARHATYEWHKSVKDALKIDIRDDYYSSDFYEEQIHDWVEDSITKITSIPEELISDIGDIIEEGYLAGQTIDKIAEDIQDVYKVSKDRAVLLARDQVSTLNANLTKQQHLDAGVTRYKWSTSRDRRVRPCHAALDGQIIDWNNPPEMWYPTKSKGIVYTGRYCHPGQDYCCRCVAIPVFDIDMVSLPMESVEDEE